MTKLKIGISCYPTYGGSGIVATELGKSLASRGHEVHFITYAMPTRLDRFQDRVFFHEVEVPDYPLFEYSPYSLALASVMADVARHEGLDLIHAHYAIPHAASAFLAREILNDNLKIVTTLHGTDITLVGNEPSFLPIVKFSIEKSDGITAVSQYLADSTKDELGVDRKIEVIPNFIDPQTFIKKVDINLRRRLAMDHQPILMHMSNFRPVKRPEDLIRILQIIRNEVDPVLVLIGDGPMRSRVEKMCRDLRLCDSVMFLGKQLSIVELLSLANVYLCTSETESFGLSALEAMACGTPVVSSNTGGVPEVITDGEEGFLLTPGDVEGMAEKVVTLLRNKEMHTEMSRTARQTAVEAFDRESVVNQYEALYHRVLNH